MPKVEQNTKKGNAKVPSPKKEKKMKDIKPKDVKVKKVKDNNIMDKSINVPVMRCVSQLKILLNRQTKDTLALLHSENPEYFEKEKEFNAKLRKMPPDSKDGKSGPKKKLHDECKEWKSSPVNIELTQKICAARKKMYRISGPASKYISQILELVIKEMLKYGIDVSSSATKGGKTPKLEAKNYVDMSEDNLLIYPLISGLKIVEDLHKVKDDTSRKDEDSGDESKDKKKTGEKRPPSYQMVVHNMFRQLTLSDSDKKCCSKPCKFFISDILMELVERQAFYLSELVGNTAQASTVSEKHVLSTCRLLFYNVHRNLDEYNKFAAIVQNMYDVRFKAKGKTA